MKIIELFKSTGKEKRKKKRNKKKTKETRIKREGSVARELTFV